MKKRVADILVETLIKLGITDCFSVVGGGAMHLNNAFVLKKDLIRTIYNHHEQACSMAAEGYARLSGKMAAVCVTSGPGSVNALNGVQGAWVDSVPMIVISGYPRYETTVPFCGLNLRSRGVQENDIVSMVSGITKYAKTILDPVTVKYEIEKAIYISLAGRRGPVWINVPLNVQGALVEEDLLISFDAEKEIEYKTKHITSEQLNTFQHILDNSERPVILTGSGIRTGNAINLYKQFINTIDIPIVGGALQSDINYNGEKNYFGMSGSVGPRAGNFILEKSDLIIVLANSLPYTQTGHEVFNFAANAKFIMVDAEEDEAKKEGLHIDLSIICDIKEFFEKAVEHGIHYTSSEEWMNHCNYIKSSFSKYEMLERHGSFEDNERVPALLFWQYFMKRVQNNAVINLGNSSSVTGLLQEGIDYPDQRVLINYKCGSMGDDITQAIGAATYNSTVPQYCITGDGSVMMNIQEFQTIRHYGFPIKTVVFSNNGYGGIRNTCENFFDGVYNGCTPESGISFPNFEDVAKTFGLSFRKCLNIGELDEAIDWIVSQNNSCILEICERIDEIKGPKLASVMDEEGKFYTPPLYDLSPLLERDFIRKLLLG
ncbi:acetolactate synthase-1/2/3 large subunit [Lachnospiraceae bacterium G41]|nr:acetolactate synthase-1/2/3 large subunit [Lachnospiraceae bacterium G41]